jgi:hypothetical protein
MKPLFTEYDPHTGWTVEYLSDGKNLVERTTVDRAPSRRVVDHATQLRNNTDYSKAGIKNDWWHVADIPAAVQLEWMNQGFDITKASTKEILAKLRHPDYAWLRTTSGKF